MLGIFACGGQAVGGTALDGGTGSNTDASSPGPGPVVATAGASCTSASSSASNQPDNPCAAGYILACDNNNGTWIKETIECFADSSEKTRTTAGCGPSEVLYVDDAAGDPCLASGDGGDCGPGGYFFEPNCCYYPTDAYCVPVPNGCGDALECSCANTVCESQCGGGANGGNPGVMCSGASAGVID